jgi:hypothetical protein
LSAFAARLRITRLKYQSTFVTIEYRKHIDFEDWHFHPACPGWPDKNYIERIDIMPPSHREVCLYCVHLGNDGNLDPTADGL